jgi:peptidoglycan hydrolase CwlO-like protein
MKKNLLLSLLALVSVTSFSCTADDVVSESNSSVKVKTTIELTKLQASEEGPGDQPIIIHPPK